MENTVLPPFMKTNRRQSDDNLSAQRKKTNQSLKNSNNEAEVQNDKNVQAERDQTDERVLSQRVYNDSQRDLRRETKDYDAASERKDSDGRLKDERRRSDTAIELERAKVDFATDREREINKMTLGLVERERKMADETLHSERISRDGEVFEASSRLSLEIDRHSKTKVSLTTRDEILAIVSHDLRNPIGAVFSCAEMLLDGSMYKQMDPELKRWLEFIKRNADVSLRLINDLLDMERVAVGKLQLQRKNNDLPRMIQDSLETAAHAATVKSLRLVTKLAPDANDIHCDRDRIMQVMANLIGNAIKFTPEHGMITVTTVATGDETQITVSDSGVGVPPEKRDQIFERFAQIASTDRKGLGLGLYISKMLLDAHDGRIWVESKVGHGSSFSFSVPKLKV